MNTILGLKKLKEIFEEKNWKEENYFFNKCCDVFIRLNSEEQVFFLKLVKNFKWVRYTDYLKELKEILSEIYLKENKILKKKNEIYILPLLNLKEIIFESEDRKTKSSNFLCYLFCSHELFNHCIFDNKKVRVLEKAFFLQKNKDNNIIFLHFLL